MINNSNIIFKICYLGFANCGIIIIVVVPYLHEFILLTNIFSFIIILNNVNNIIV